MLKRISVLGASFFPLATIGSREAYAYYADAGYIPPSEGLLSPEIIFGIIVLVIAVVMFDAMSGGGGNSNNHNSTDTAEHYEQEALRLRAYARKLDAETAAKDSQVRSVIKSDELKEVERLLRNNNSPRGR